MSELADFTARSHELTGGLLWRFEEYGTLGRVVDSEGRVIFDDGSACGEYAAVPSKEIMLYICELHNSLFLFNEELYHVQRKAEYWKRQAEAVMGKRT